MYLRYEKDGRFSTVSGIAYVRLSHGFVECLDERGGVSVSFPQDCPYLLSVVPFSVSLDDVVTLLIGTASAYRERLSRSDYLKLYAALNGLRYDKN